MKRRTHDKKRKLVESKHGVSPEQVAEHGVLLAVRKNPKYPGQLIEVYFFENYVWVVVVDLEDGRFVTAYRSRKLKKEFKL